MGARLMASIGVRPIKTPKFNPRAIERAILKEKRAKGRDIVKELEKTVRTWSGEKPKFSAKVKDRGKDVVIEVTFTGAELALDKWRWLDEGTDPHDISPVHGQTLRFNYPGFEPKTKVGVLNTVSGKLADGPEQHRTLVKHPGFAARGWTEIVRKMMEEDFGKRVRMVLKRVIEKGK